jgi:hypothetical protein
MPRVSIRGEGSSLATYLIMNRLLSQNGPQTHCGLKDPIRDVVYLNNAGLQAFLNAIPLAHSWETKPQLAGLCFRALVEKLACPIASHHCAPPVMAVIMWEVFCSLPSVAFQAGLPST